jgi:hypothetical protein
MIYTNRFVRLAVEKLAQRAALRRTRRFCSLVHARHILILCEVQDILAAEHCLQELQRLGKEVVAVIRIPVKNTDWKDREPFFSIRDKIHISHWGFPLSEVERTVTAFPADILIDLSEAGNHVLRYLMLRHSAPFRVGLKRPADPDMHDFDITFTEGSSKRQLVDALLHYLRTIQTP